MDNVQTFVLKVGLSDELLKALSVESLLDYAADQARKSFRKSFTQAKAELEATENN